MAAHYRDTMAVEQTLRRAPALCSLEDPHSYSQASVPEGLMEPTVSAGLRGRNVDIERGEQSYKAREGESVRSVIFVQMSFLMCLRFGLLSSASAGRLYCTMLQVCFQYTYL